ncbi:MAG: tryptophan 2,3-dioxygenase [Proteobacteria bacterium]|nr:tryptophan 2,3-dioxygenase [Pseudomonadota bacterium]NDC23622.1 tryptophan 2,3-dioxygenase [Pseudomonadota bacterium]NDD03756.1 tryptophan 2,3-dioxygenase [Pseudomonadota bacterium]NDG26104.1 tryptophan 2,3-dioxygenase [Pseudomonadota bacterium]
MPHLTYSQYLKVEELLELQAPLTTPSAPDELLFIITHQSYELWFKLVIHELDRVIQHLNNDRLFPAFHLLERVSEVFKNLIHQLDILETMTPVAFNQFRSQLNPASGFQSWQFRELELMAGGHTSDYSKLAAVEPEWYARLKARGDKPNLRTVFLSLIKKRGLAQHPENRDELLKAILSIYEQPIQDELQTLCEFLIRVDEQIILWRFRHVQMVERMIGMKHGTGGSLGVPYLETTLKKKFFPELWQARTAMGTDSY